MKLMEHRTAFVNYAVAGLLTDRTRNSCRSIQQLLHRVADLPGYGGCRTGHSDGGPRRAQTSQQGATAMGLNLMDNRGVTLDRQRFTWRDMVQKPISKLNDDACSRVHIILLNGLELEALNSGHACARMNNSLQPVLAQVRRVEQHQATAVTGATTTRPTARRLRPPTPVDPAGYVP
ncbi:hypothetical protein [Pelomonas cellulosilytica]|uniref:Uncharacterized protein n=1 Tax=Pelomonas cellulosilytica TaxID=2906762 RepID=A0ABS8XT98_9BURK|nr:hypothetical protein [Pelomonas sp. P8]MCE4555939.1 hypothetical protein [Pelomonas sp. P8]